MRIQVKLPVIEPGKYEEPEECPYQGCGGQYLKAHGVKGEVKVVRDFEHEEVQRGAFGYGGEIQAAAHKALKVWSKIAERMTNIRSAPGRDQRIPAPVKRDLNCLMPLSMVPEPMG